MDMRFVLALPLVCTASAEDSWDSLGRLHLGERITIVQKDSKQLTGEFTGVSGESISLRQGKQEVGVERGNVVRVSRLERSKRLRNALIGAAIGAGVGIAIDRSLGVYLRNEGGPETIQSLMWIAPIGLGAALGASVPSYPSVYRAK